MLYGIQKNCTITQQLLEKPYIQSYADFISENVEKGMKEWINVIKISLFREVNLPYTFV